MFMGVKVHGQFLAHDEEMSGVLGSQNLSKSL